MMARLFSCRSIPLWREARVSQALVAGQRGDVLHLFIGQAQLPCSEVGGYVLDARSIDGLLRTGDGWN
jgi:hypothetical protein